MISVRTISHRKIFCLRLFLPLLADAAFIGLDACVPHLVPPHVGAIGELHIANVAFEELPVVAVALGGWLRLRFCIIGGGWRGGRNTLYR